MACGAKVPHIPKTEKKKDKKKKRSVIKTAVSIVAVFMIVILFFSVFGDNMIPERVRGLKAYSLVAGTVKDKVPDEIRLPFGLTVELPIDLPADFAFKLPFDLKERLSGLPLLGFLSDDGASPAGKKVSEEPEARKDVDGQDRGTAVEQGNHTDNEAATDSKVAENDANGNNVKVVERSEKEREFITAGTDNSVVLSDYNIFEDIPADWIRSNVRILEHRTDVDAGTDTVTIYLEMENSYVNMTGTKEITYQYNEETGDWEAGPASKINCLSIEPVTANL